MRLFYNTGIYLLDAGLHAAGMFNDKARLWCRGRRRIFSRMAEALRQERGDGCPDTLSVCGAEAKERTRTGDGSDHCTAGTDLIWFHCASLGEFEQGRPVIEAFRAAHPGWKILLTFFSPSGYEVRKNYAGADYIFTCGPIRRAMPGGSFRFSVRRSPYSSNTSFGPTTCSHCSAAVRGLT